MKKARKKLQKRVNLQPIIEIRVERSFKRQTSVGRHLTAELTDSTDFVKLVVNKKKVFIPV